MSECNRFHNRVNPERDFSGGVWKEGKIRADTVAKYAQKNAINPQNDRSLRLLKTSGACPPDQV
jgi:hypothetical protein